jgi:uncharacterized UBP type Zn finger protein
MKRAIAACPHGASDLPRRKPWVALLGSARSRKSACETCGETDDLRVCQTCGHVACCESHNGHDTDHFEKTGHSFIRPRVGRDWLWCYQCRAYLE